MMTMLMMERIIATSTHKTQEGVPQEKERSLQSEPQIFLQPKRISDDSRDAEMCEEKSDEDVDVENDDALCPVDLTRRQDSFTNSFESFTSKTESSSEYHTLKDDVKRAESVCSDQSRSRSPVSTDRGPSTVTVQNRRLAFSVENILDPNKFTGRQICGDDVCCWKQMEGGRRSPDFDGSDTGMENFLALVIVNIDMAVSSRLIFS